MRRYTTPTITLTLAADISAADIYVTFKQHSTTLTKSGEDVTAAYDAETGKTTLTTTLSQTETASFSAGAPNDCFVQVNWITSGGERGASKKKAITIEDNNLSVEVEYGADD